MVSKHKHETDTGNNMDSIITAAPTAPTAATQESIEVGADSTENLPLNIETDGRNTEERLAQLEQELQLALQVKDEYYNRMVRTQADFDNFRRRSRQEFEQITTFAGEDLVKKILPVLDCLGRACSCFKGDGDNTSWQDGVDLTLKQFQTILKNEGLEEIPALNEPFDPQIHEAVLQEETDTVSAPVVLEEMQKGYKFRGKLIRPALVKVAVPQ